MLGWENLDVSTDVYRKVCAMLNCAFDGIVEIKAEESETELQNSMTSR